jgi:hypothetical protein
LKKYGGQKEFYDGELLQTQKFLRKLIFLFQSLIIFYQIIQLRFSAIVDIKCLPTVMFAYTGGYYSSGYYNAKLCKWESNGSDYYDSYATAYIECPLVGPGYALNGLYSSLYLTNTNFAVQKSYFKSATCSK